MVSISAIVLLALACRVKSGPLYENNPFFQVSTSWKQSSANQEPKKSDIYVVSPSTGQQLQQSSPTARPFPSTSASTVNHVHSFDCANLTNYLHVLSQKPFATAQAQHSSNSNFVHSVQSSTVNALELNKRCLKSAGLFLGSSCNKFVSCLNGTATELSCPDGLLFNSEGLYCDRAENVQCDGQRSAAIIHHQPVPSTVISPIHANLVQFSAVPSQNFGQAGQVSAAHVSQIHFSGVQQEHKEAQQHYQSSQQQQNQKHEQQYEHKHQQFQQQGQHHSQNHQYQTSQQQQNQKHEQQYEHKHQQENQQFQQQGHHSQNHQYETSQQQQNQKHKQQYEHKHQQQNQQFQHQHKKTQQQQQSHPGQQYHQSTQQNQQQNNKYEQHQHQPLYNGQYQQQHNQQQQQNLQQQYESLQNTNIFFQTNGIKQQEQASHNLENTNSFLETNEIQNFGGTSTRCLALKGQFPSNACHTYLNCWAGIATEQACPDGLLFNAKGYCDYPENVNCAGRLLTAPQPVVVAPSEAKSPPPQTVSTPTISPPTTNPSLVVNPTTLSTPTAVTLPAVVVPELKNKCLSARGQFPSNSCNKFVNCWDNIVLEQDCPEGFLFSTKGYCDYSHKVYCGERPIESRGTASGAKSECPLENGTFRDRNKCSSYFTCIANKIVAKYECPDGLNYNDYLGVCDFDYRVDCSKEPLLIPGRSNKLPQLRRGDQCPADFATYRDVNNCAVYYTCVSKTIVATYECPVGFSFNDEIGVCDYAERVDCSKAPKIFQVPENVLPQVTNDIKQKMETCTPGTMFPLNQHCTAVCLCREGGAEIVQCPAGLAYDSKTDKCILPHLAKC